MTNPVILTGIRANNDLTIGNYFGAIKPTIDMARAHADEYQINLFIPDLHSFTTPIDHSTLLESVMNNARIFAAAGLPLDHDNIYIYRQSYISAHSELTWILDCFTGFGEMSRMTQFKDKSSRLFEDYHEVHDGRVETHPEKNVTVGLFNYPVLMAADILLYSASYVPVGEDQTQHLEFTRDIAERFNHRFGDIFTIPKSTAEQNKFFEREQALRIKDLVDPSKKMSKSDDSGRGVIFLHDTPDQARKKIMSATTDSLARVHYDKTTQSGISNLIDILALLRGVTPEVISNSYDGLANYGEFKTIVADEVAMFLEKFQTSLANIDDQIVLAKLESSESAMRQVAGATLLRAQRAVGLR